jgi:hypothetical protein
MADELDLCVGLSPAVAVNSPPTKAEFMCDLNFEQSRRRALKTIEVILQGRDVAALMQQHPSFVFTVVYQSERLARVRDHENEALVRTYDWFQKKFQQFDITKYGESFSLMTCLVIWINRYLRKRLEDLRLRQISDDVKRHYRQLQVKDPVTGKVIIDGKTGKPKKQRVKVLDSLDQPFNNEDGEATFLDHLDENHQINLLKSRSAIHNSLNKLEAAEIRQNCQEIKELIINDPEGKLRAMCIDGKPEWNCQEILYRLQVLHEKQSDIAKDLGANNNAIERKLRDHAYPYLGSYAIGHGYEPATTCKAVLANPQGILTKTKMKDANGKNNCPQANAYYFAQQFLIDFGKMRSTEDVTRELVDKYQYNITVEMVQEFWDEEGKSAVAKAVRIYNVKKHPQKDQETDS